MGRIIFKEVLPNGLRMVVEEIPAVRSVSLGIWIGTGSRYETAENNGISHLIEHMLFKGTERFSAKQIAEQFDSLGGFVNAFTAKEYTCYYMKVLDEHLEKGLDVLADMFFHSKLDEQELEKEKRVIIEEIKMYDDTPDELVHDLLARAVFPAHPLGWPIPGIASVVQSLKRESLLAFMAEHYTANNTVVAVAGHVTKDVIALIERYFAQMPSGPALKPPRESAVYQATEQVVVKDIEQAHLCMGLPGLSVADKDLYALILLNNVLGGSMSSRLFQEVREERGLAYSVYSYTSQFLSEGVLALYAGTSPEQVPQLFEVLHRLLYELQDKGLSREELAKGKEQLKGNLMLGLESTSSRMNRIGKNELILGEQLTIDDLISRIEQVNLEQTWQLIQRIFSQPIALSMVSPLRERPKNFRRDRVAKG